MHVLCILWVVAILCVLFIVQVKEDIQILSFLFGWETIVFLSFFRGTVKRSNLLYLVAVLAAFMP